MLIASTPSETVADQTGLATDVLLMFGVGPDCVETCVQAYVKGSLPPSTVVFGPVEELALPDEDGPKL